MSQLSLHLSTPVTVDSQRQREAFLLLRTAFTVAPILFGLDKFFNLLTDWEKYLAPWVNGLLPGDARPAVSALALARLAAAPTSAAPTSATPTSATTSSATTPSATTPSGADAQEGQA